MTQPGVIKAHKNPQMEERETGANPPLKLKMRKQTMDNELTVYGSFIKEIKDLIYRRQYDGFAHQELVQ